MGSCPLQAAGLKSSFHDVMPIFSSKLLNLVAILRARIVRLLRSRMSILINAFILWITLLEAVKLRPRLITI